MNVETFRGAIRGLIQGWAATYADTDESVLPGDLHVFYENGPEPNLEDERVWLDTQLRFYSANTVAIGRPDTRHSGVVSVAAYVRETEGTRLPDRILSGLTKLLRHRHVGDGSALLLAPERTIPPPAFYGWYRSGLMVPFQLTEREGDV